MPVRILNIVLAVMVIAVAVFSFYLYAQQRKSFEFIKIYGADQQKNIEELKAESKGLKKALDDQGVKSQEVQQQNVQIRELIPQIKDSIVEIKSVISQGRVEASMIKEDAAQWKKDYVAVLIEMEERLKSVEGVLKNVQQECPAGALVKVQNEVDLLKDKIKKINVQVSALGTVEKDPAAPTYPLLPRFDPDWKK